jgi:hypothetical protein
MDATPGAKASAITPLILKPRSSMSSTNAVRLASVFARNSAIKLANRLTGSAVFVTVLLLVPVSSLAEDFALYRADHLSDQVTSRPTPSS